MDRRVGDDDRWRGLVPETLWIQLDSDAGTQIVAAAGRVR